MATNVNQRLVTIGASAISLLVYCMLLSGAAWAQDIQDSTEGAHSPWGIGTSITYPLAEIYMIQVSYSPWESGDILFGAAYQNWENDQGRSHAYTFLLGYRQFLWGGIHTEIELWPAYNPFHSSVDGEIYTGFELWMSIRIGYKFEFELASNEFFVLLQPSIGFGVARENPWPDKEENDQAIFEPQLVVGIRF